MARCEQCGAETTQASESCAQCGAPVAHDPLLGQDVLDRYRIERLIGEGGMGRVYEAVQRVGTTSRRVAIKTLLPQLSGDPQIARRFFREAETIVRLSHPNTIQLFDFGKLPNGMLAIAMEFIEGRSLAQELTAGPLASERVERILAQICGALAEAHALGIIHRDLKPDNVLLTARGGQPDFVKVLDFGIAKISEDEQRNTKLTQQGMMVGTPPYMSPEQFSGDAVDARSDIYSLGVIAYEMLSGRLPFDARTPWEWASKHLTAPPLPLAQATARPLSVRYARAIERAMAKNPAERPASVAALLAELTGQAPQPPAALGGIAQPRAAQETPARQESLSARAGSAVQSRPVWPWLAAAALLAASLLVARFGLEQDHDAAAEWAALDPPPLPEPAAVPAPAPQVAQGLVPDPPASKPRASGRTGPALQQEPRTPLPKRAVTPPAAPTGPGNPTTPATPAAPVPPPGASVPPPPARPLTPSPVRDSSPRVERLSGPAAADLQARVDRAIAAASDRVETAVGLYQAAAARYGAEQPALIPLRSAIAQAGGRRIRELLAQGRCAQAQAFLRALHGVGVDGAASPLFGGACPRP